MLTNWHTLLRNEAHTLAGQALSAIQLAQHNGCTWEATCARAACSANFLNRPMKTRFNGRGTCVNVVAVQAQASF